MLRLRGVANRQLLASLEPYADGLRGLRLRGGGDAEALGADVTRTEGADDDKVGAEDQLFDGMMRAANDAGQFLAKAYATRPNSRKEAVGYLKLLLTEPEFLQNISPRQFLQVCRHPF